jgi:large conductance mechanosensitive channel
MKNKTKHRIGQGLLKFLKEYSVLGMAIGVIIAQVAKDLIDALVRGLFMPFLNLFLPENKFQNFVWTINGSTFDFALIINTALTFVIVMVVLYIIVKKILKQEKLLEKK